MLLIISLVVLLFVLLFCWYAAIKSQSPKRVKSEKKPGVRYEEIEVKDQDKILKGWFIPSPSNEGKQPLIIVTHGWGSSKERMLRYVEPLHEAGYALILFDTRAHGESSSLKTPSIKSFRDDIQSVIHYAKSREDIDQDRIGLFGHSFGGFGSVLVNKSDEGIKAVVTDSMPLSVRTIMEAGMKQHKLPYLPLGPIVTKFMFLRAGLSSKVVRELKPVPAIQNRKAPLFMIHSQYDDFVPSLEFEQLVAKENIPHLLTMNNGKRPALLG